MFQAVVFQSVAWITDWRQNLDQMDGNGEVECFCHATDTELIVYNFTVPLAQDEFLASL